MQPPPMSISRHTPKVHSSLAPHLVPQEPQLSSSEFVSLHSPLQHDSRESQHVPSQQTMPLQCEVVVQPQAPSTQTGAPETVHSLLGSVPLVILL